MRIMIGTNLNSIVQHLFVFWTLLLVLLPNIGAATNHTFLTADQKRLELINGSMSVSVSPCEDFVSYACRGLVNYRRRYFVGNLELLDDRVDVELTEAIRQLPSTNDYKFLSDIHSFYTSCTNEEDRDDSLRYLKWMSVNADVKWPMAEEIKSELPGMDWVELLAVTRKYGFNDIFLYEDIIPLPEDSSKFTIEFKRPPLAPIANFVDRMTLKWLSTDEIEKFAAFQNKLLNITCNLLQVEGRRNILTDLSMPGSMDSSAISLKDLDLPWINKYIQVILEQSPVDLNMIVYVQNKDYLKGIGEFLSQYDNRFLSDYIQIAFLKYLHRQDDYSSSKRCIKNLRDMFPLPMQWLYKSQHPELQKELPHIKSIFDNLKGTFKKSLTRNIYNFPPDIVKYLQTKIESIELSVDAISGEALEDLYRNLHISSTDYYGNRLELFRHYFKITHGFILQRLTRNSVPMLNLRPADITDTLDDRSGLYNLPYLFPRHNLIFLPLTLLQDPYYEPGLGDVYSYSTIGFLLAHQIVKAFDFRYLRVDAKGRYNAAANETIQLNHKFHDIARTLQEELMIFKGKRYEALADMGGLKLAHDTMLELHPDAWLANVTLHGELVTIDKVFFMSFAHNYCADVCQYGILGNWDYSRCKRVTVATEHLESFIHAFGCGKTQSQNLWP